jgi:fused signal recognition particle receptor
MFSFFNKNEQTKSIVDKVLKIQKDILEDILLQADVEYELVEDILENFSSTIKIQDLQKYLLSIFDGIDEKEYTNKPPFVDIVIGVNGAGKTTSIAKLAYRYKNMQKSVLLGGADTFRAAAVEQLTLWAEKIGVEIVKGQKNSDPSAVAYNTLQSAVAKKKDYVIIDTAGRLQNHTNLLNELDKIIRVSKKVREDFPTRKLLVIDSMQGNMAIQQALVFSENIGVDGIIITKLDGSSKGGALLSIVSRLKIPILYVGVGEKAEDLREFDKVEYINTLIEYICQSSLDG